MQLNNFHQGTVLEKKNFLSSIITSEVWTGLTQLNLFLFFCLMSGFPHEQLWSSDQRASLHSDGAAGLHWPGWFGLCMRKDGRSDGGEWAETQR